MKVEKISLADWGWRSRSTPREEGRLSRGRFRPIHLGDSHQEGTRFAMGPDKEAMGGTLVRIQSANGSG